MYDFVMNEEVLIVVKTKNDKVIKVDDTYNILCIFDLNIVEDLSSLGVMNW